MTKNYQLPKISVITPSLNQGRFIRETIDSVLNQNYPKLEHIIIDGGSTDDTLSILKSYGKKIKWISEPDQGQSDAINKGINLSSGKIITYLNSDDTHTPQALIHVGKFFAKNKKAKFVHGIGNFIYQNQHRKTKTYDSFFNKPTKAYIPHSKNLINGCYICQPTAFWRKGITDKIGLFDTKLKYAMDYDYWIRISKRYRFHYIPIHLANFRIHPQCKSSSQSYKAFLEAAKVQQKYFHQVSYLVTTNVAELENKEKLQHLRLIKRLFHNFKVWFRYNSHFPPTIFFYHHLVWIKELVTMPIRQFFFHLRHKISHITYHIDPNLHAHLSTVFTALNLIIHQCSKATKHIIKTPLYVVRFMQNPIQSFYKLSIHLIPKKYFELGQLQQHYTHHRIPPIYYPQHKPQPAKQYLKISVITPSYNQGQFIKSTINSLLDQKYPNLEYIVQDGGSTDQTIKILKSHKTQFIYESKKDQGQSHAINLGMRKASGDILAYLNSDDIYLPNSLFWVNQYFLNHPRVDVIYSHRIIINEHNDMTGRWILAPHSSKTLLYADFIPQETLFWRRSIWNKVDQKVNQEFHFTMDWDLLLRFQQVGAVIHRVPTFLAAFRVHSQQKTSSIMETVGHQEYQKILQKYLKQKISEEKRQLQTIPYIIKSSLYSWLWDIKNKLNTSYSHKPNHQ